MVSSYCTLIHLRPINVRSWLVASTGEWMTGNLFSSSREIIIISIIIINSGQQTIPGNMSISAFALFKYFRSYPVSVYYCWLYEVHKICLQPFFVWTLLFIVHTWNSSPLQSNLLRLQCTCCTVPHLSSSLTDSLPSLNLQCV